MLLPVDKTSTISDPNRTVNSPVEFLRVPKNEPLTLGIFAVVCLVLCVLTTLLGASLYFQYGNYAAGINAALAGHKADHNSVITYSRAWDFAVVKTSSLFLSFTLIFVGALYVLRVSETRYGLNIEGGKVKGSLETSSPGLVMITLGVTLTALAMYSKSLVDYRPSPSPVNTPVALGVNEIRDIQKVPKQGLDSVPSASRRSTPYRELSTPKGESEAKKEGVEEK